MAPVLQEVELQQVIKDISSESRAHSGAGGGRQGGTGQPGGFLEEVTSTVGMSRERARGRGSPRGYRLTTGGAGSAATGASVCLSVSVTAVGRACMLSI